jgi:hypothetical protein
MTLEQLKRDADYHVAHYQYDDESVLAVDFGGDQSDTAVDVVDGTAIVVIGDDQYEIDLPESNDDPHTFMKNGVLSIEMEETA